MTMWSSKEVAELCRNAAAPRVQPRREIPRVGHDGAPAARDGAANLGVPTVLMDPPRTGIESRSPSGSARSEP
jgi:hypothetical protein